ncbi:MAG: hypothetical protein KDB80_11745, partial [Planctomycetes bacterium]|nr:hypothetical protein [Planctomycetota bacterium]
MIAELLTLALCMPQADPQPPESVRDQDQPQRLVVEPKSGVDYRVVPVDGCQAVGTVVGVRVGSWHDPADRCGLAAAVVSY